MSIEPGFIEQVLERTGPRLDAVIPILQAIQEHYHYLPEEALRRVTELTEITPSQIASVSTFYAQFRHQPAGKHILRVCHGTACHVEGSQLVHDAIKRHLKMEGEEETDAQGMFTIERVGCIGCCTLAPVIQIGAVTYGYRAADNAHQALADYLDLSGGHEELLHPPHPAPRGNLTEIRVGCGSCCIAGGAHGLRVALEQAVHRNRLSAVVKPVGCVGMCHQTPMVEIGKGDSSLALYSKVSAAEADRIVRRHFKPTGLLRRLESGISGAIDRLWSDESWEPIERHAIDSRDQVVCEFLGHQRRIATEYCGSMDPLDLDEYLRHNGFDAARRVSGWSGGRIIEEVKTSGLRGRGGAGFPTGQKWMRVAAAPGDVKYIICNGDEGDPGAFMDRMILESFPYRVIEGMLIAAQAVGASDGILYIRAEYPLAVKRIREAIGRCESRGLLGLSPLRLRIVEGAGAFVCGEETALIASIEGRRGFPRLKPPFPADSGLNGNPTCINNVETYALVPWIIRNGAEAFASIGTERSKGTKVFALTGKIRRGGLIEVPMGVTIREIVEQVGGGVGKGRRFKAVQIGGPSGGCIPAELADLPVDFESLAKAGAIMGSGGLVVLDDTDCMVDIARYFLRFTQAESCGQCSFCRTGTKVLRDILDRLCEGKGRPGDLERLDQLSGQVKQGSLCGLGQTAPNPILTTLRYFRDEYEAHMKGQCPAGKCKALIRYEVKDGCIGCTKCAIGCPENAIEPLPYRKHFIDASKCTRCDLCRTLCPEQVIKIT